MPAYYRQCECDACAALYSSSLNKCFMDMDESNLSMCMLYLCCLILTPMPLISGHDQFPSSYTFLSVSPLRTWSMLAGTGCHKHVHHSTSSSCIQGSPTKWKQNATKKQKQNEKKSGHPIPPYPGQPVVRPVCALILGRGPIWGQGYATLPSSTPV